MVIQSQFNPETKDQHINKIGNRQNNVQLIFYDLKILNILVWGLSV